MVNDASSVLFVFTLLKSTRYALKPNNPTITWARFMSPISFYGSAKRVNVRLPLGLNPARLDAVPQSLAQRALAAEAEAELLGIKLTHAFEELRDERIGCVCDVS